MLKKITLLVSTLFLNFIVTAQTNVDLNYYFGTSTNYNKKITTPTEFFGFTPGEMHLRHDQIISYIKLLSTQTDRLKFEQYASSYENRQLFLISISSPQNIYDIERIKKEHHTLSEPGQSSNINTSDMPIVVWLGFSVHGNEASGSNSVPLLIYQLVASEGIEIDQLLSKMIILIDPCVNPDGFDRFASWVNVHKSKTLNADPNSREHQEYWPGGRGNHYWFDMNRDWLLLQHPEAKGRVEKFHEWKPNVLTDHHEMGGNSTFFFQPGVVERNNPLTPTENFELTKKIAEYHAKALDKIGSLYFSGEVFDDFYYGKGSSYPDINGSIGILFEQAGVRGIARENENGLLTFPLAIRNQLTTALSTIKASQEMRVELLDYQRNFYLNQIEAAKKSNTKAFVFSLSDDNIMNKKFMDILKGHQIKIYKLKKNISVENFEYKPENSYIIPTQQSSFGLINSLFQKSTVYKDSIFYDISAWTLPLAFNVPFASLTGANFHKDLIGENLQSFDFPKLYFEKSENIYAYAFEWKKYLAPNLLNKLLNEKVIAKVASLPFSANTKSGLVNFDYGTIVIPIGIQQDKVDVIENIFKSFASDYDIKIHSIISGKSESGIDLGSGNFHSVKEPNVMMVVGQGVSSLDAGEIWYLLDQRMEMSLSLIEMRNLNQVDFSKYTSIILTGGSYRDIDSLQTDRIKRWIQNGGTLISTGIASDWLIKNKFTKEKSIDFRNVKSDSTNRKTFIERSKEIGALSVPGAIFEANLDITNPIGYGYTDSRIFLFMSGDIALQTSKDVYSTPLQYTKDPLVSGFISKRIYNHFKGSAAILTDRIGRGNVIMMTEGPNYRAFWLSTNKLLMNSIFFGSLINTGSGERDL